MNLLSLALLLQDNTQPPAQPSAPSFFIPMLVIGLLAVFLLILPERKKQKQRQQMLDALEKGDRVMTTGGLYGTVVSVNNEIVVLQVADGVRLRFSRAAVQAVIDADKEPASEEKEKEKAEPSKA